MELCCEDIPLPDGSYVRFVTVRGSRDRPALPFQLAGEIRRKVAVDVIILTPRVQAVKTPPLPLVILISIVVESRGIVPTYTGDGFSRSVGIASREAVESCGDEIEARYGGGFDGAGEKGLKTDADAEEGFAGKDVFLNGGEVAGGGEGGQAVAEVADAGEDDFLQTRTREGLRLRT